MHLFDMDVDKGYEVENKEYQLTEEITCKQYIGRTLVCNTIWYVRKSNCGVSV